MLSGIFALEGDSGWKREPVEADGRHKIMSGDASPDDVSGGIGVDDELV